MAEASLGKLRSVCPDSTPSLLSVNIDQDSESAFFESTVARELPIKLSGVEPECARRSIERLLVMDVETSTTIREMRF